jgi:hypothetical protein
LIAATLAAATLAPLKRARAATPLGLRRGVNAWPWFSLTREYPPPRTDYAWPAYQEQRPVPRREDLRRLREAGLDFVRIPVDPGPFLSFTGAPRAALLESLAAAVAECLAADLSVIVNIQASGTHYWTPERMYGSREAPAFPAYLDLVQTVASGLARFDPSRVALEPVNEPPQSCASPVWNELQATLLAAARGQAPALTLVATGGCGGMVTGLTPLDPATLRAFEPLLFTFHFYEPYLFSHQGAPWMREPVYRDLNAVPWPASAGSLDGTLAAVRARMQADGGISRDAQRAAYQEIEKVLGVYFAARPDRWFIEKYLSAVAEWGTRHGVPPAHILMGEFGALRSDSRYVAAAAPDRARYIRDVRLTAEAHGFPWAFWNLFDGMGMMEDDTRAFDPAIVAALGLRLPPG